MPILKDLEQKRHRIAKVGLVKVFLDSGETEVLITSLLDQELYPYSIFKYLYHLRWRIEEEYKTIKSVMEVESFTGQTDWVKWVNLKNLEIFIPT